MGLKMLQSPIGAEIVVDGRRYINFGGSSYLGLSSRTEIAEAGVAALREAGCGYQFPRHYGYISRWHQRLEEQAAAFFGTESALYMASGYLFGLLALGALREQFDAIFYDELAHYSLREAIRASALPSYPYRHVDATDLEQRIAEHLAIGKKPLIVTDGLFSTFGEIAPLDELARIAGPLEGRLLVDESHSFGVLGRNGRGAREHHDLPPALILCGGSLSKAFGASGGMVAASEAEIAALRATPAGRGAAYGLPAAAAMCAASLEYVREHPQLLEQLRSNVHYLKAGLRKLGLPVPNNIAPVAAIAAGRGRSPREIQQQLMSQGIFVFHSSYIGAGSGGVIRCGIFADHTIEHMDNLIEGLRRLL